MNSAKSNHLSRPHLPPNALTLGVKALMKGLCGAGVK